MQPLHGLNEGTEKERGKKPRLRGWKKLEFFDCDDAFLRKHFGGKATANLGMIIQPPHIVIDLDSKKDDGKSVRDWLAGQPALANWQVESVELSLEAQRVEIAIEWQGGKRAECPQCGRFCKIYDLREERSWRHLDTMQFKTVLQCRTPRIDCPDHGVQTISTPWADTHGRFTLMFEVFAIRVLLACSNVDAARRLQKISWAQAKEIWRRALEPGLQRHTEEPLAAQVRKLIMPPVPARERPIQFGLPRRFELIGLLSLFRMFHQGEM